MRDALGCMLEHLSIRRYEILNVNVRDNPIGAGNQQERPLQMLNVTQISDAIGYYFAGFVDGEGSFRVSFPISLPTAS